MTRGMPKAKRSDLLWINYMRAQIESMATIDDRTKRELLDMTDCMDEELDERFMMLPHDSAKKVIHVGDDVECMEDGELRRYTVLAVSTQDIDRMILANKDSKAKVGIVSKCRWVDKDE